MFAALILFLAVNGPVQALELNKKEQAFLRKKQTVVFVSQTRYPPFEFVEKDGGHNGMCIELARWMATELGFTARFTNTSFQEAQKAVLSGKADVLTSFFYSEKRDELFDFTPVLFEVPASIFVVAQRTDIKDLNDLNGKMIAMQAGDYAKEYLESKNISFDLVYTKDFADATDLVIAGEADVVIGDEQIVLYHIFKNRLTKKIKKVGEPLYVGKNCMATRESNAILIGILEKGITLAQKKGILGKINRKWIGTRYSMRETLLFSYLPHIFITAAVLLVLLLLVWFWNVRLRQEVGKRTRALEKSERRYRRLFEESRDAIYSTTKEGEFIDVNPAMLDLFGYTREQMIGRKTAEMFANPEGRKRFLDYLSRGSVQDYEIKAKKRDGTEMDCLLTATPRQNDDGDMIGYQGIVRDVTEKRRLEAQLRRSQRMEALGTLAGGVAHDLNNILSGITSYPELLLMQIPEESPLRKPLMTIQESGTKAAAVVQDLLTMARRGVAAMEVVNLNNLVEEYLHSPEYKKLKSFYPHIEVKVELMEDLLDISGSRVHLDKTVMNLLSNAAEAMPKGGNIHVSTKNQYIDTPIRGYDEVEEGDYAVLTVADTGSGISKKDMERIFEPFYTKKKMGRSGSGLGLAVVWGTVRDHRGYIEVQSTEGKGTSFTLYFPVARERLPERATDKRMETYRGRGESVLIVDDVREQRDIALDILTELGYSAAVVSSGEEAIEYLKKTPVDLVVLDMIMDPGMDGLDTYKSIVEIRPGQKAVIASGFSETDRVKEAQQLGAGPYIKKPYTLAKIGRAVRKELDK